MPIAELFGKLSSEMVNSEDLLTSDFFGSMRYIDPNKVLKECLIKAVNKGGDVLPLSINIIDIEYIFWKNFKFSQPDVVIKLKGEAKEIVILVEAKFKSGLSSVDQLKREWDDLLCISKSKEYFFIYLTSHRSIPKKDIETTEKLVRSHEFTQHVFWLSWYSINQSLKEIVKETSNLDKFQKIIIQDLVNILDSKGFERFIKLIIKKFVNTSPSFYIPIKKQVENFSWKVFPYLNHKFYKGD